MARARATQGGSKKPWRALKRGFFALGIGLAALLLLVLISLDLRPTRELVRTRVNAALAETFAGQILLDRIGSLRLDAVGGIDAHVLDAERRTVATVRGLRVRSNWPAMLRSLVLGRPLHIVLEPLHVDHIEIRLLADKEGIPTLASAFYPRHREPASTAPSTTEPLSTSVVIGDLHVRHLWAHGSLPSVSVIDAEISNLRGSFQYDARGLAAKVGEGRLRARGLPARVNPSGALSGHFELPPERDAQFTGSARFAGTLASGPATLTTSWKGPALEARLLAPNVPPRTLRELLPGSNLEAPTNLEAHVRGHLPRLNFDARVSNAALEAKLDGHVAVEDVTQISAELTASRVDLQLIFGDAPKTHLSATASARASIVSGGTLQGEYRISVAPGRVAANDTPSLSSTGRLIRTDAGALRIDGKLQVEEPGAKTDADYHLSLPSSDKGTLNAKLEARLDAPPRLRRLAQLQATGTVDADLALDLASSQLAARVTSELTSVVHPNARAQKLRLALNAAGAPAAPELELTADARDVVLANRHFQRVQLTALGKPERLRVQATADGNKQRWQAAAQLVIGSELVVSDPSLLFSDHEGHVEVQARRLRILGSTVQFDELGVRGLGELSASGSVSSQRINVQFTSRELDLARLSRLSGLDIAKGGKLSLEGQVAGPFAALQGKVKGQARELDLGTVRAGKLDIALELGDRKLNLDFSGRIGCSELEAKVRDLDLPSRPFTTQRLQALRGEVSLQGTLDLRELAPALRALGVPLERAGGQLTLDVRAENPRAGEAAGSVHLEARVKSAGLSLVGQRSEQKNIETPSQAREAKPPAVEGVDLELHLVLDPASEHAEARVSLFDQQGPLLNAEAEAKIGASLTAILNTEPDEIPLRLTARAPERAMEKLPAIARPNVMRGLASFELDAEGTLREPKLRAALAVRRLQAREGRNWIDLRANAEYTNSAGKVEGQGKATRGGTATLSTNWHGNLLQRVRGASALGASAFELDTDLVLDKFPLAVVPELSDNQVRGPLSGEVRLRGLGRDAELTAHFDGSGVTVNRIAMPELKASVRANANEVVAMFDATQSQGSAHAELSAPSAWGARWTPKLEPRAKLTVKARAFELEALSPVLTRYLSTLEGQLDADLSAQLEPQNPQIQGTATLTQGVIQLPQLGQRFSDVQAKVSVRDNEIRVDGVQARGVTGRLTAEARAKLSGTSLQSASVRVAINAKEKLPITFEGVVLGDAWGHATLAYSQAAEKSATEIKIDVPDFRIQMPDAAQNSVQDLDPADDIRIGAHRADGRFAAIPLQPLEDTSAAETSGERPSVTRVHVHLGNSVWVDRGRQASVQLTGDLEIASGAEQQVRGRIELRGGRLDVSGKQFEIERGVVSFEGDDPGDPTITATARWDSPAEYTVYAEYAGTVKNGKLKLRAEPALTQDEILSLLLFGAPTGSMGGSDGGASPGAGTAVSVAGDTATKGLNRAISDITSLDVSTRIDTSTGSARPELVVQLTPRLTTRVTRAVGEPTPGQSPDRTFLTLELRLKRSWAISAVVGDHGASALDLIWRKRY
jgi:translocation and assembly module TamB